MQRVLTVAMNQLQFSSAKTQELLTSLGKVDVIKNKMSLNAAIARVNKLKILKEKNTYFPLRKYKSDNVVVNALHRDSKESSQSKPMTDDVPGLSSKVVNYGNEPVGSGALKDGEYKNPEYFSYNELSYYEAEIEMAKYRLPQPVSRKQS
ncbi:hypothetical protein FQR65_LT00609 [Abscondita terminalis]|nr:hypothetical protein FQR65_LT00609 [Abscondita terminalis]